MQYDPTDSCVYLSLPELCAYAHRHGDLRVRHPRPRPSPTDDRLDAELSDAPAPGKLFHNVTLRDRSRLGGVLFCVSGTADGLLYDPMGGSYVEVTASVYGDVQARALYPDPELLARLCALGYFFCASRELPEVALRLTLTRPGGGGESAVSEQVLPVDRLRELYVGMLEIILPRAQDLCDRQGRVRDLLAQATFPYPTMRGAQEDMIRECYRDLCRGQTLFAQAPTGIGKTISTLYPAIRAIGTGHADKIFYLTAKGSARREALKAARHLLEAGAPLRACSISARETVCPRREGRQSGRDMTALCDPALCPYAKGYYDRIGGVLRGLLSPEGGLYTTATIRRAAEAGMVCPYELSLDLSELCEVIVCDYNYVFSPTAYLRRYFRPEGSAGRYIFLVDEAHGLPDRARDMYSGGLSLTTLQAIQDAIHRYETEGRAAYIFPDEDAPRREELTAGQLDDLIGALSRMKLDPASETEPGADGLRRGATLERGLPVELTDAAETLSRRCARFLRRSHGHPLEPVAEQLAEGLRDYLTAALYYGEGYVTYVETVGEEVAVRLLCLDPAPILRPLLHRGSARVLFSATLTPTAYFADVLGGGDDSVAVSFPSPFPPEHLCVTLADHLSVRWGDRDRACRAVVSYIAAMVSVRRGNYLVYLPSYDYLDKVAERFRRQYPRVDIIVQSRGMTAGEREAFIRSFQPDTRRLHIGFCVLGGAFSEGVDLPGSCLIGTLIVGVGMPGLSDLRNIMREYYDETREGEGLAYAYTYPGMNRVLQAAGRVIRTPTDRGVVVLLDDRWGEEGYRRLLPEHWTDLCAVGDPQSLAERLRRFWEG